LISVAPADFKNSREQAALRLLGLIANLPGGAMRTRDILFV
jgi:hypothetical protein